jgi:hypothetical protein
LLLNLFESVVVVTFLKCFFILKCIKIIFFYFLKIIFDINASKRYKLYKNKLIFFS